MKKAEELFVIADLSKVWAVAEVPEQQIDHLKLGQRVHIEVPALNNQTMEGEISFIGDIAGMPRPAIRDGTGKFG